MQKFLDINIQDTVISNPSYKVVTVGDLFDLVCTSSEIQKNKHSDKIIKSITKHFGVSTEHLMIIDDSEENTKYFQGLGANVIHYRGSPDELLDELKM